MQIFLLGVCGGPADLLPLAVGLSIAGFWLVRSGWRARSDRNEHRCGWCQYEAIDPTINRCPRCGVEPAIIHAKHPARSGLRLIVGYLCLLAALFVFIFFPLWVPALLAGLFGLNLLFLHWLDREDQVHLPPEPSAQEFPSPEVFNEFLREHGSRTTDFEIPLDHLPLHVSFIELFRTYDCVTIEEWPCYERSLLTSPYEANSAFLQFGTTVEGSPILARRCCEDPVVYISDIDECMPEQVFSCATSLQAYFFAMQKELGAVEAGR